MSISGCDVSFWQDGIGWVTVGQQPLGFAVTKCTEGADWLDPTFVTNITAIRQTSLIPGHYHYGKPGRNPGAAGAIAEAKWFLSQAGWRPGEIIMLDQEDPSASSDLAGWSLVWLDYVAAATGASPLFYSYRFYIDTRGGADYARVAARYGLWIAGSTGDPQPPWPGTAIWQDAGQSHFVAGISGAVDFDQFFGSRRQLLAYCGSGTAAPFQGGTDMPVLVQGTDNIGGRVWIVTDPLRRAVPSGGELQDFVNRYGPVQVWQQEEIDAVVDVTTLVGQPIDLAALAAALAPHLPPAVDEAKLAADLEAVLPGADAEAIRLALGKALGKALTG